MYELPFVTSQSSQQIVHHIRIIICYITALLSRWPVGSLHSSCHFPRHIWHTFPVGVPAATVRGSFVASTSALPRSEPRQTRRCRARIATPVPCLSPPRRRRRRRHYAILAALPFSLCLQTRLESDGRKVHRGMKNKHRERRRHKRNAPN